MVVTLAITREYTNDCTTWATPCLTCCVYENMQIRLDTMPHDLGKLITARGPLVTT